MSGIKYYQLKEDEELPDEFCAVKDANGEPSEYTFYRPEAENAKLREKIKALTELASIGKLTASQCTELAEDNAKLRELVAYMRRCYVRGHDWGPYGAPEKKWVEEQMRELGIETT